jgi:hypothetical protein
MRDVERHHRAILGDQAVLQRFDENPTAEC